MQIEYPDWDIMNDFEKKIARDNETTRKWREKISTAQQETAKIEKWSEEVDKFTEDPQTLIDNPELEGKTSEFTVFATEEANNSVPMKVLVGAFLHEQSKSVPKNKGKMFERGTGGEEKENKDAGTISPDEAATLMKNDYKKYKSLLLAGKIRNE